MSSLFLFVDSGHERLRARCQSGAIGHVKLPAGAQKKRARRIKASAEKIKICYLCFTSYGYQVSSFV